jgi:hypothetical protein
MRSRSRFTVAVFVSILAGASAPAQAQLYPFPGRNTSPPVICTTCALPNRGLPTAAYKAPLAFVGRYVDSQSTLSVQNRGMRTVRARKIRVAPTGRIYIGLGEAIGGYRLDRFFVSTLRVPMVPASVMGTGEAFSGRSPIEKIARPDSFFYAEAGQSSWVADAPDAQVVIGDFDVDDRGYLYVGTKLFGWGVEMERGVAGHMAFMCQNFEDVIGESVVSLRTGGKYYVVISDAKLPGAAAMLRDVTVPSRPLFVMTRKGAQHGILKWAKFDPGSRLAVIGADGKVRIYDYADYVKSGIVRETIAPPAGKSFTDLTFDERGTLWITESGAAGTSSSLWRLTPTATAATGYVKQTLDIYGSPFSPERIAVGGGFIAVAGRESIGKVNAMDIRLFRIGTTGIPTLVDTGGFFRNYYYKAPAGFAGPGPYMGLNDLAIITQGGKRYLLHSAMGLGDVFEITGS